MLNKKLNTPLGTATLLWWRGLGALMVLRAIVCCWGLFRSCKVTQDKLVRAKESAVQNTFMMVTCVPCLEGHKDPVHEPGVGKGSVGERLVAGPLSMGSSRAVKGRGFGGPIPGC